MTVILVLLMFVLFILMDHFVKAIPVKTYVVRRGTMFTTSGFEMLGSLAQDGGEKITQNDYQI